MELLIVGLDGLSRNMLERFNVDSGYIDTISSTGFVGELWSVDSPTTLPAWTSLSTGKDPGSHGIYGMMRQEADYGTAPAGQDIANAAIYDLVDDAVFINLPGSERRRATAEGTYLVSSFAAEDKYDATPELFQSFDSFEAYRSTYDPGMKKKQGDYVTHICDIADRRFEFATEAFDTVDPRVGFLLFSATDWIGHFLTNTSSREIRGEWYRRVVERCLRHTESLVRETGAKNVVVMSDHGFEHKRKTLHLNDWFVDAGYASRSRSDVSAAERGIVLLAKAITRRSDGAYELIRRVYNRALGVEAAKGVRMAARTNIDHEHSLAWELRYGNIFINDDRFENPAVGDAGVLRDQLQEELETLTDEAGHRCFREVLPREEVYANPTVDLLPDLIARPSPGYHPTRLSSPTGGLTSPTDNFDHRYRGIFAAKGPAFSARPKADPIRMTDVLPTLLHAISEPVPGDVDGSARLDLLSTEREVSERDPASASLSIKPQSDDRVEAVEERLADLGYLE